MSRKMLATGAALAISVFAAGAASAAIPVYVGYADSLRANSFFPVPWVGDPNTVNTGGFDGDRGAVRIDNTTGAALSITGFSYTINGGGSQTVSDLVIPIGDVGIFILSDTSDQNHIPGATYGHLATGCAVSCPMISFSANGVSVGTLNDSGHVLDTGGFDFAQNGSNESFAWRLIGTAGGQGGVPEPATWAMLLVGFGGLGAAIRGARRQATAATA